MSLNPARYARPAQDAVKVTLTPLAVRGEEVRRGKPIELDYFHVDHHGFGVPNAIIFRPKVLKCEAKYTYLVQIAGVTDRR